MLTAALSCGASDASSASGAGGGGGGDGTGTGTDIDIPQDETCGNGTVDPGELCYELQTANWPVDGPSTLAMRDLDGDGLAELIAGDESIGPISDDKGARVIWGNPEGRIDATQPLPYPPELQNAYWDVDTIATGDFNGDGRVDIALWDYTLTLAANQGDRSFTSAVSSADMAGSPALIGVGDVDGDGVEDLVLKEEAGEPDRVEVWYGSAEEGLVGPETVLDVDALNWTGRLADVDEDGLADLLIRAGGPIDLYLNEDGTFPSAEPIAGSDGYIYVFDTNADAHVDLLINSMGQLAIGLGDGSGSFSWQEPIVKEANGLLLAGDVDGNGDVDIVEVLYLPVNAPMSVYVYLGQGDGRFDAPPREMTLPHSSDPMPTIGDLNGDGVDDLVMVVTGVPSPEPSITTGFGPGHTVFALVSNP